MGLLDSVLGGLLGGGGSSPLQAILASILGGGQQGGLQGGLGGLLRQLSQAGYGDQVNSWVGSGPNQPIHPGALRDAFGQDQVNQWSQQTGMGQDDLLHQLSQMIPHAVDRMTPDGQVPDASDTSAFDGAGMEPPR